MEEPIKKTKFRAWDKKNKVMIYDVQNTHDYTPTTCENFGDLLEDEDYEVMQFTGLYDENGREIYEGDIVEVTNLDGDYVFEVGIVEFITPKFVLRNLKKDGSNLIIREGTKSIVKGNIYESPELLTKENK